MKTKQVYEKFLTPKNLQEHMLRVASLAKLLSDYWSGESIDRPALVKACLIHDIAKPITFDPDRQVLFGMTEGEIANLKILQEMLKSKYGGEEHPASVKIGHDLGLNPTGVRVMENLEWHLIPRILKNKDLESIIAVYCDMRIGPRGILPLSDRLMDLESREPAKTRDLYQSNGEKLEREIKDKINLDINSITDWQLESNFNNLLNLDF